MAALDMVKNAALEILKDETKEWLDLLAEAEDGFILDHEGVCKLNKLLYVLSAGLVDDEG